ncbi:2-hydroxyacid dehydrogenase [Oricola sp.]|uniref:2-hydroxyacid dehydrogenase n=1 Tax=Oricola sp. TaxID=1979950 RepID=UPI003BA9DCF0
MRADAFASALNTIPGACFSIRTFETDWPEHPFGAPFDGIKEYQGSAETSAAEIGDSEICITHLAPIPRSVFEKCPNLKLIGVSRGGPVNVDIAAAREHGVQVVNAPGRNATAVAEFTIGAILCQTRRFTLGHAGLSKGIWRGDLYRADRTGQELSELTVGLIGYSAVGRRVAHLLEPFGCRIVFSDPYVEPNAEDAAAGITKCDFATLLRVSDVVSLHARLTPETRDMFTADTFASMKQGAYLINTARGELIDQQALTAALQSGHLGGAALDTYVPEPPAPNDPLLPLPNVTLTPHIAGASVHVVTFAANMIAADVGNYLAGKELNNPC